MRMRASVCKSSKRLLVKTLNHQLPSTRLCHGDEYYFSPAASTILRGKSSLTKSWHCGLCPALQWRTQSYRLDEHQQLKDRIISKSCFYASRTHPRVSYFGGLPDENPCSRSEQTRTAAISKAEQDQTKSTEVHPPSQTADP